jgi:hypothetical protein
MTILKTCERYGTTLFFPTLTDGKCFCSPQCEALYREPEILNKTERKPPGAVRRRAAIMFKIARAICAYPPSFPPRFLGSWWIDRTVFLVPLYLLVELVTGTSVAHAALRYQSLAEWNRALIMIAIFLCAARAMMGAIHQQPRRDRQHWRTNPFGTLHLADFRRTNGRHRSESPSFQRL